MSLSRYGSLHKNFYKWTGREPEEHEEPTKEQLSIVEDIFQNGSCHVDYAKFGANSQRTAEAMKGFGWRQGPENTWVQEQFKGPHPIRTGGYATT